MNLPPRQQQILELVRERGYVSIEEMAQLFVVTAQSIRRDINQLADGNLLRRYHGGAAYLAGLACGFWGSLEELRGKAVIEREFEPQLDEAAKEKLYAGWQKAVSRTRDWEPHEGAE